MGNMILPNMMNPNMFQNLLMQGQHSLGPNGVLRIVQDLKARVRLISDMVNILKPRTEKIVIKDSIFLKIDSFYPRKV